MSGCHPIGYVVHGMSDIFVVGFDVARFVEEVGFLQLESFVVDLVGFKVCSH